MANIRIPTEVPTGSSGPKNVGNLFQLMGNTIAVLLVLSMLLLSCAKARESGLTAQLGSVNSQAASIAFTSGIPGIAEVFMPAFGVAVGSLPNDISLPGGYRVQVVGGNSAQPLPPSSPSNPPVQAVVANGATQAVVVPEEAPVAPVTPTCVTNTSTSRAALDAWKRGDAVSAVNYLQSSDETDCLAVGLSEDYVGPFMVLLSQLASEFDVAKPVKDYARIATLGQQLNTLNPLYTDAYYATRMAQGQQYIANKTWATQSPEQVAQALSGLQVGVQSVTFRENEHAIPLYGFLESDSDRFRLYVRATDVWTTSDLELTRADLRVLAAALGVTEDYLEVAGSMVSVPGSLLPENFDQLEVPAPHEDFYAPAAVETPSVAWVICQYAGFTATGGQELPDWAIAWGQDKDLFFTVQNPGLYEAYLADKNMARAVNMAPGSSCPS